jgi:isoleucyl-tRNA synthetase
MEISELEELFSVSSVELAEMAESAIPEAFSGHVNQAKVIVEVSAHSGLKCCRCWRFSHEADEYAKLCQRCSSVVDQTSPVSSTASSCGSTTQCQ